MGINCLTLGAGQEVGKSCVVVTLGERRIMFDCGMHMGFKDHNRTPAFSALNVPANSNLTQHIHCVIITHFHLDHCGSLPYFTEVLGYEGPIFMTYPTKALIPLMLEDYRRVSVDKKGQEELFSNQQLKDCMSKVTAVDLRQDIHVLPDLLIRAYYAGHVLGAAMFYAESNGASVVYSGDYNMTPDRHLGAAQIDRLEPDLLITESTYGTTVRESTRAREREFLKSVHECIDNGGKVLIPVFAIGRAQELCILLDEYWERMGLTTPIYLSAGLTIQASVYYKMLLTWTSQKAQSVHTSRNTFDFHHVSPFDKSQVDSPAPCVLFATPGMLSGGLSLEVFKKWAPSPKNMLIIPGYCISGTVGSRLQNGKGTGSLHLDKGNSIEVNCKIHQLSVSAHTDAKGILDMVRHLAPRQVMLVHGEKLKMAVLKDRIEATFNVPCIYPANLSTTAVPCRNYIPISVSTSSITAQRSLVESLQAHLTHVLQLGSDAALRSQSCLVNGHFVGKARKNEPTQFLADELNFRGSSGAWVLPRPGNKIEIYGSFVANDGHDRSQLRLKFESQESSHQKECLAASAGGSARIYQYPIRGVFCAPSMQPLKVQKRAVSLSDLDRAIILYVVHEALVKWSGLSGWTVGEGWSSLSCGVMDVSITDVKEGEVDISNMRGGMTLIAMVSCEGKSERALELVKEIFSELKFVEYSVGLT